MKKHYIQIGAGNYTLCGEKLQVVNQKGNSVSEMLGNAFTFTKSEVTCEKCTKILNQK